MISDVFYFVLNMSIMAALMIVLLLLFRILLLKWFPKYTAYFLWGIILIRLCIPVAIQSKASLLQLLTNKYVKIIDLPNTITLLPETSMSNAIQGVTDYFPLAYKSKAIENFFQFSGTIWLVGAGICLILFATFYRMTSIQLNKATRLETSPNIQVIRKQLKVRNKVQVYQHNGLTSPLVFGVLRPRILLPCNVPSKNLDLILRHELVHIKRHDNLWKLLSILAVCIHWFNPFAWLFLYFSSRDMELACDEKVLNILGPDQKKEYAQTLLLLAAGQNFPLSAFGNTAVKSRILRITTYKKLTLWMVLIAAFFSCSLALMLLTNP